MGQFEFEEWPQKKKKKEQWEKCKRNCAEVSWKGCVVTQESLVSDCLVFI